MIFEGRFFFPVRHRDKCIIEKYHSFSAYTIFRTKFSESFCDSTPVLKRKKKHFYRQHKSRIYIKGTFRRHNTTDRVWLLKTLYCAFLCDAHAFWSGLEHRFIRIDTPCRAKITFKLSRSDNG